MKSNMSEKRLIKKLNECTMCPHKCRVNRNINQKRPIRQMDRSDQ